MEYLANLYAKLAASDVVRKPSGKRAFRMGIGEDAQIKAATTPEGRWLPLVSITGISSSPERAVLIANRIGVDLQAYVAVRQRENSIPERERIIFPVVTRAGEAKVLQGVKLTTTLMVAMLGTVVTLFVAFSLDNARRHRRSAEAVDEPAGESALEVPRIGAEPETEAEESTVEAELPIRHIGAETDTQPQASSAAAQSQRWG